MKIAVLTTCLDDYKKYTRTQYKELKSKLCKISVLKDITEEKYSKMVLLKESRNVTDTVINKVKESSIFIHDLSNEPLYY